MSKKRALLFEPAPYHYTLIGSYVYYLSKLGYAIDLLTYQTFDPKEDLFWVSSEEVRVLYYSDLSWSDIEVRVNFDDYDLVWITTINRLSPETDLNLFETLGFYPKPKDGLLGTTHDIYETSSMRIDVSKFAGVFTLSDKSQIAPYTIPISVSYYGDYKNERTLGKFKQLTSIGANIAMISAMLAIDEDPLHDTYHVTRVSSWKRKRYIIEQYYNKLAYTLFRGKRGIDVGRLTLNPLKLKRSYARLETLTNIPSSEMYRILQQSDFLIANYEGYFNDIFSQQRVGGSFLLSLGFCVPLIINESVAYSWGLDNTNAAIFPDNRFDLALKRLHNTTNDAYAEMKQALKEKQKKELSNSIEIISATISNWKNSH